MTTFKPGDRIRRIADPLDKVPLGFETVVAEHSPAGAWELVPDEPALPVRTRTITEIVSGQYGQVSVIKVEHDPRNVAVALLKVGASVNLDSAHFYMNSAALRAAARVFVSLAEALEWNEGSK